MRAARLITVAAGAVLAVGWSCMPAALPRSAPRNPVPVKASLARTWEAVLATFADRKIAISQDSSAGTVAFTQALQLSQDDSGGEDCPNMTAEQVVRPQFVTYRVVVKGDSHSSNVVAYAMYTRMPGDARECASRGTWETAFEGEVKRRAEQQ